MGQFPKAGSGVQTVQSVFGAAPLYSVKFHTKTDFMGKTSVEEIDAVL